MKLEKSTFERAGEAQMLAVDGQQQIARAILAFFVGLFARKKAAASKAASDVTRKLVLH
jgi:hypothetical protein